MHFKNKKINYFVFLPILVLVFLVVGFGKAEAASYWVSPTGMASWANCQGEIPLNGAEACNLSLANSNAVAGDVVNINAGTYI